MNEDENSRTPARPQTNAPRDNIMPCGDPTPNSNYIYIYIYIYIYVRIYVAYIRTCTDYTSSIDADKISSSTIAAELTPAACLVLVDTVSARAGEAVAVAFAVAFAVDAFGWDEYAFARRSHPVAV